MARFHDIDISIWEELKPYSKDEKLLYIFAFSNSLVRDSGIYKISLETIKFYTGLNKDKFKACVDNLNPKLVYDYDMKVMFVSGKFKRRLSGLKSNKNLIKAVEHDLELFKDSFVTALFCKKYEGALKGLASPPLPLPLPLPLPNDINNIDNNTISISKYLENGNLKNLKSIYKNKQGIKDHLIKTMGFAEVEVDAAMGKEF